MKFVDKWPNAKVGEETDPRTGMFKADRPQPCCMCKRGTRWISSNWMSRLCSEECEAKLKEEYQASRKPDFWTEAEETPNES